MPIFLFFHMTFFRDCPGSDGGAGRGGGQGEPHLLRPQREPGRGQRGQRHGDGGLPQGLGLHVAGGEQGIQVGRSEGLQGYQE